MSSWRAKTSDVRYLRATLHVHYNLKARHAARVERSHILIPVQVDSLVNILTQAPSSCVTSVKYASRLEQSRPGSGSAQG